MRTSAFGFFRDYKYTFYQCYITGLHTHGVGDQTSNGRWHLLSSSSVTLHYTT